MEKSMFFNSIGGDRRYKAEEFADYFNKFIGNGVFPNPSTNCQVLSNNDMTIRISPGSAWINGYMYINTGDMNHVIEPANSVLSRIDRVVLRWDKVGREIYSYIKVGEYSSSPQPKPLQRDVDAYELCLADIRVNAGVTTIAQSDIRDTRLNNELCGIVHGTVEQVDTTTLFNQYVGWYQDTTGQAEIDIEIMKQQFQSDINLVLQEWRNWFNSTTVAKENEFNTWFENVQIVLDGDVAGNLYNLINTKMDKKIPDESYEDLKYEFTMIEGKPCLRVVN